MVSDFEIRWAKAITAITIILIFIFMPINFVENRFTDDEKSVLVFKSQKWHELEKNSFLIGITTASAAIVAIGFSINNLNLNSLFTKYGSKKIDVLFERRTLFYPYIGLVITILASLMILLNSHPTESFVEFMLIMFLLVGFTYCIGLFVIAFYRMLSLTNTFNMNEYLRDQIIDKIKNA